MKPPTGPITGRTGVRVPKTAEIVADVLRRQIVTGVFPDGGHLPSESELMAQFVVSRPSLREALRILESEDLVVVRRGARGGARACRPNAGVAARYLGLLMQMDGVTLSDVYLARVCIEPVAVRLLAVNATRREAVEELRRLHAEEHATADDPSAYNAATLRFHQRLVELSGNQTLGLLWSTLQEVLAGELLDLAKARISPRSLSTRGEAVSLMLDRVEAGDADAAHDHWRRAMLKSSDRVFRRHGSKTVVDLLT